MKMCVCASGNVWYNYWLKLVELQSGFTWPFILLPFSLSVLVSSLIWLFKRLEKKARQRVPILYLAIYTAAFLSLCFSFFLDLLKSFWEIREERKTESWMSYMNDYEKIHAWHTWMSYMNYYEKNPCLAYMYVIHEDELVSSSSSIILKSTIFFSALSTRSGW